MCFSVQVERDLEKLAARFGAKISVKDFEALKLLQEKIEMMPPENVKKIMGLKRKPSSPVFKESKADGRIYPGYFAPVIVEEENEWVIKPMRYRVRPALSAEEIPSKYNVFNARLDSLEKRRTWSNIFMKNHGLFPFKRFYEWVERKGAKKLIEFHPNNQEIMWAPMIYDRWASANNEVEFSSFALITTDPPQEVEEQGHDRSPIFLKEKHIKSWLKPSELSKERAYELLSEQEETYFDHDLGPVK